MKIKTGKGTITLTVLLAIWSVSAIASLPGLAISPILGDLNRIFPKATDLEIQMLTSLPSLLIIPFVLLSGRLSVGRDKLRILTVGLAVFFLSGVACIFAKSMAWLIVISCILGIGAGMVIPLSTGLVVDYFTGDYRVRQLGYSSAINNLTLECQDSHIFRLNRKECNTEAGMLYLNTITDFERVGDHAINIAFLARSK